MLKLALFIFITLSVFPALAEEYVGFLKKDGTNWTLENRSTNSRRLPGRLCESADFQALIGNYVRVNYSVGKECLKVNSIEPEVFDPLNRRKTKK